MGKSTASCFKIIACGGDSVDHDDLQTTENKSPSDRRGWSFRKRSARHRVLSNSVATETPSSETKDTPESTAVSFHVQPELTVPEKSSAPLSKENIELSAQPESKLSEKVDAKDNGPGADATPDEPSIVVIQTAIRGLLAQRMLLKQKTIIKLQAVVRGHLVRRYAVGTLRCVQAIIRMQALVRARQKRLLAEGSCDSAKQCESSGTNSHDLTPLMAKKEKPSGPYTYISIDKLLSNAFARQLMESTPRTKPINIKCEPSKSDSAWKWLERWMSVSSVTSEEPLESESDIKLGKGHVEHSNDKEDDLVPSDCYSEPRNSVSVAATSAEGPKEDHKLIGGGHDDLDTHCFKAITPSSSHSDLQSIDGSNSRYEIIESASTETRETNLVEKVDANSFPKGETSDQDGPTSKMFTNQPEIEATRFSRKPSNPAFIAAQSKFEELSLAAPSAKLIKSSIQDPGVDFTVDKVSSTNDQPSKSRDFGYAENAVSNSSTVQIVGSECGTELSISSTLDSPERPETGGNEIEIEQAMKVSEETNRVRSSESLEHEANGKTIVLETAPSNAESDKLDRYESINSAAGDESLCSMTDADSPQIEKKTKAEPGEPQPETGSKANHPVNKSSPEASPSRSHITVPESQATPSTEVSVKPKRNKQSKSESNRKSNNKSSSADKKSLSNRNQDSASKSSLEQLQDHTTGKRRNSLGSGKPEHKEHGVRDSSSSNSLPSYMQATESARAKAISNGSPRSSPDVHDKDIYIKKRHSLPSSNERQGSPRIQRSLSQAQQNAKGSVTQSPQERMWRR